MTFRGFSRLFILVATILTTLSAKAQEQQHQARLVVHLLDYLAKDYAGAVGDDGKILSESEYAEQVEFAQTAAKAATEIPELKVKPEISAGVNSLLTSIQAKEGPAKIIPLARSMQAAVLDATKLQVTPARWPNYEKAKKLYADNCALCHGVTGGGDGPAGMALDPAPANFLDNEAMSAAAPMGEFNTIRLGVPGTGMAPYPQISDEDTWSLAAYVLSLRHQAPANALLLEFDNELLKKSSTLSDIDLAAHLNVPLDETRGKLAAVRLHSVTSERVNTLALARDLLKQSSDAFTKGDLKAAKDFALQSYLQGIEPVEPRLQTADSKVVIEIEETMIAVRAAIAKPSSQEEFSEKLTAALKVIDKADGLLGSGSIDSKVAFVAASGILLREGFEAALIILSLLSVIRAMGVKRAARWVHSGWILAVALGVLCWFLLGVAFDVSGAARELMEGFTSLFAVLVLITVGFWLHRHAEIGRWTKFLREKVQHAADTQNLIGLFTISFLAVFREAIETVLFLRVIWFDADQTAKTSMLSGLGITAVLIILGAWAAIKYSAKLPISKLFTASALIMGALAFILTGKGVHSLQEAGYVSVNSIMPYLRWELLGVYPSVETLAAQIVVLAVVVTLWVQGKKPTHA